MISFRFIYFCLNLVPSRCDFVATTCGSLASVIVLLRSHARVNSGGLLACGVTPVHIAAADGRRDILQAMFKYSKDNFYETLLWSDVRI